MPAIFLSLVEIADPAAFGDYMAKTQKVASKYDAQLVFMGEFKKTLNQELPAIHRAVAVRFKDMDTLNDWYNSDEYQALIPLPAEGSKQTISIYEEA